MCGNGDRFHVQSNWEYNRDDLIAFNSFAASENENNIPFFLGGESYGACLAIHVARYWQDHPDKATSDFRGFANLSPVIIDKLPPQPVISLL